MLKRILAVLVAAPLVLGAVFCPSPWVFKLLVLFCIAGATAEFFEMVGFSGKERGFGVGVGIFYGVLLLFTEMPPIPLFLVVIFSAFSFFLFFHKSLPLEGIAPRVALLLLGQFYIVGFGVHVGLARSLPDGTFWVMLLLTTTWLNDTFAYFVGHRWGKRRLAPQVSPGKSVEGFFGGFLGSFLGLIFCLAIFKTPPISWGQGIPLVILVGIFGPIGDLSESLLKRSFHVKDSGTLIPGHGGMLDRIDALLFTAPVVYYYAQWVGR